MADPSEVERSHLRRLGLSLLPVHHGSRHSSGRQQKQTDSAQKYHPSLRAVPHRRRLKLHHRIWLLHTYTSFHAVRILGILQRLAICYGVNLFVHWVTDYGTNMTAKIITTCVSAGSVLVYVALMVTWSGSSIGCSYTNNLDPYCNLAGYVDRAVFTEAHIM